jgi:hypothetical protein
VPNIKLVLDTKAVETAIVVASRGVLNSRLSLVANGVRRDLSQMIETMLKNTGTYESLVNGQLKAEFGLKRPVTNLSNILKVLRDSINVRSVPLQRATNGLRGGLVIDMVKADFSEILSLADASYQRKDWEVPWLKWLLTEGDRIIISTYHISYNLTPAERKRSFSGVALMEKGGGWRVPPQFAGTIDDNWITRAFNNKQTQDYIHSVVEDNLRRNL